MTESKAGYNFQFAIKESLSIDIALFLTIHNQNKTLNWLFIYCFRACLPLIIWDTSSCFRVNT